MFEFLKKIAGAKRAGSSHVASSDADRDLVFWVDMPRIAEPSVSPSSVSRSSVSPAKVPRLNLRSATSVATKTERIGKPGTERSSRQLGSHRERLLAMNLEHLKLFPIRRCEQLASVGIQTAGDLVYGDPKAIAATFDHSERAERALRRYRAAIRMALAVDSMMPRDALLLVAIHRRSVASLSRESAAQLHRDLERFSLSTRGSKLVGRRGVPSLRRVKAWVATCRELAETSSMPNVVPAIG